MLFSRLTPVAPNQGINNQRVISVHPGSNFWSCVPEEGQTAESARIAQVARSAIETNNTFPAGKKITLTPEESIRIQNAIGADIAMQLDDVVPVLTTGPRVEEAMNRLLSCR